MRLLTEPSLLAASADPDALTVDDLLTLYAVDDAKPSVRANMVVSLDGRTTGGDHVSGTLSSPADRQVFAVLRSLSDAVLVGAGTARAEGYRPARIRPELQAARQARGRPEPPVIAIVSRSLTFDPSDPLFVRGSSLFITGQDADDAAVARAEELVDVIRTPSPEVDLKAALAELRRLGHAHVLCEGGPGLLTDALTQDVIDELCLTIAPTIIGGAGHRLLGNDSEMDARFALGHVIEADGVLMTRYVKERA